MQGNGAALVLRIITSISLIRRLYLKGLATPHYSPMSQMMFTLLELICVDDAYLNVINIEDNLR